VTGFSGTVGCCCQHDGHCGSGLSCHQTQSESNAISDYNGYVNTCGASGLDMFGNTEQLSYDYYSHPGSQLDSSPFGSPSTSSGASESSYA
jgi:hypothetical protein